MNGDLDIKEDTKVSKYYALNADYTGVINVNIKDARQAQALLSSRVIFSPRQQKAMMSGMKMR